MALGILLLTGLTGALCAFANAYQFGPMRGLLVLVQLAVVLLRDSLLAYAIGRQSRWLAAAYMLAAAAAFLCLLASQHGYGDLPDSAEVLAPLAAFGIPLAALLATHWPHPFVATLLAAVTLAGVYIDAHIVPQIVFRENVRPLPLPAEASLEAWWPHFHDPDRDRILALLKQRPTLEADLIAGMQAAQLLEILHTFDYITALRPAATPALRVAFRAAQKRLPSLARSEDEGGWRMRSRFAAEALGEAVP